MAHEYTVKTSKGDVDLKTPHHHSTFDNIEEFLDHHKSTINSVFGAATVIIAIYYGEKKIK